MLEAGRSVVMLALMHHRIAFVQGEHELRRVVAVAFKLRVLQRW